MCIRDRAEAMAAATEAVAATVSDVTVVAVVFYRKIKYNNMYRRGNNICIHKMNKTPPPTCPSKRSHTAITNEQSASCCK